MESQFVGSYPRKQLLHSSSSRHTVSEHSLVSWRWEGGTNHGRRERHRQRNARSVGGVSCEAEVQTGVWTFNPGQPPVIWLVGVRSPAGRGLLPFITIRMQLESFECSPPLPTKRLTSAIPNPNEREMFLKPSGSLAHLGCHTSGIFCRTLLSRAPLESPCLGETPAPGSVITSDPWAPMAGSNEPAAIPRKSRMIARVFFGAKVGETLIFPGI